MFTDELKALFDGGASRAEGFLHGQFTDLRRDVCSIRNALDALDTRQEWIHRKGGSQAVGGATAIEVTIPGPRPGFMWVLTRLTTNVPSGLASIGVVYAGIVDPANAMCILADADFAVEDLGGGVPVFPNTPITFALTGMPANGSAMCSVYGQQLPVPE